MSSKFLQISSARGGKPGAQGPPGPAGPTGATGATGPPGPSGSASTDYSPLTDFDVAKAAGDSYGPSGSIRNSAAVAAGDVLYELAGPGYIVDNLGNVGGSQVFVGIATAAAAAYTTVPVAVRSDQGTYVAVNRTSIPNPPQEVKLDASTNGSTATYPTVAFRDSGGLPSNYLQNESYTITFDAGAGQSWQMTPQSFEFEHSGGGSMYDRLGIQTSTDGATWANASLNNYLTSATQSAPWSTSQGSSGPGWILPATSVGSPVTGATVAFTTQYVRFVFFSDGSAQRAGWDITMLSTAGAGNAVVAHNTPLYVDVSAPEKVSETPNGPVIAYSRGLDSSGDKIYARLV
jgi:hypothetical protein